MSQFKKIKSMVENNLKNTVRMDIERYLEKKENMPSLEEYLQEKHHYLHSIWDKNWKQQLNVIGRKIKVPYLQEKGYNFTQKSKVKVINKIFNEEIQKENWIFDMYAWVQTRFGTGGHSWEKLYSTKREQFLERERKAAEERRLKEIQNAFEEKLTNGLQEIIEQHKEEFYTYVRLKVANALVSDFIEKARYEYVDIREEKEELEEIGLLFVDDFPLLEDFFNELTGDVIESYNWGKTYYDYRTYREEYNDWIRDELITGEVFGQIYDLISQEMQEMYKQVFGTDLEMSDVWDYIDHDIWDLEIDFMGRIEKEPLVPLLQMAEVEFDVEGNKAKYEQFMEQRRREKEELERKINDIFGKEYHVKSRMKHSKFVLHIGETNTGKTYQALNAMKKAESGVYLAPLRLLALEVFDRLNKDGVPCNLLTGEEEKTNAGAEHVSCTIEMYRPEQKVEVLVIDEAQMLADTERGFSWYKAISQANADEIHIIGSENVKGIVLNLLEGENVTILEYKRETPLEVENNAFSIDKVEKGDALIVFSRARVLQIAAKLERDGRKVSVIYGAMPPETRKKQIKSFVEGETDIVVATDAIGMGLNLPIRRVVFLENEKFDGTQKRPLTSQEIKQIAGRAGRKGIYETGFVSFPSQKKQMKNKLLQKDASIEKFTISPTFSSLTKYQNYHRNLEEFFTLWEQFEEPKGTQKSTLEHEKTLYECIQNTVVEAKLNIRDLYEFLKLPFAYYEPQLKEQWYRNMVAIAVGKSLSEPSLYGDTLDELELIYKKISLHVMFLYKLNQQTMAIYWEKEREKISDTIHELLKKNMKKMTKKCRFCDKELEWDYSYNMCGKCHKENYGRRSYYYDDEDDDNWYDED